MIRQHFHLFCGVILSLAILIIVFLLKMYCPYLLDIDSKWLFVAGIPLLIALITGGYISKFKGFGLDLELITRENLAHNPSVIDMIEELVYQVPRSEITAVEKLGINVLDQISEERKNRVNALLFRSKLDGYYNESVILAYLKALTHIKYFVLIDEHDQYVGMQRIDRTHLVKNDNSIRVLRKFINEVTRGYLDPTSPNTTKNSVYKSSTIVETLSTLRATGKRFIAVVDDRMQIEGVVYERKLEACLANAVLRALGKYGRTT